jgi:phage-related minor tail protein
MADGRCGGGAAASATGVGDGEPVGVGGGGQRRPAQDGVRRLGAFLVGWEIGTWLSEKFEIVRKAGIFMVEMLVKAVEQLRYRWEAFAAIFTSDTIAEATKRHEPVSRR